MKLGKRTRWVLACLALASPLAFAQDAGPILRPNKPASRPASPTLLVVCDLDCNWKLDGEAKGSIGADDTAKVKVELGQHLLVAVTADGLDRIVKDIDIKNAVQTVVHLELKTVREQRLKADQEARDKLAQEVRARDEQVARDRASQEARDKADKEARAKDEQVARDQAAQEARAKDEQATRDKAEQSARDRAEKEMQQDALKPAQVDPPLQILATDYPAMAKQQLASLSPQGQDLVAAAYLDRDCKEGKMDACYRLGLRYETGLMASKNESRAVIQYATACNGGNSSGCVRLANAYSLGLGVKKDTLKAWTLFRKACDAGDEQACLFLGRSHQDSQNKPPLLTHTLIKDLKGKDPYSVAAEVDQVGGRVSAPLLLDQALSETSGEARRDHFAGTCVLSMVVDENGRPNDFAVVHGMGMGLDEKAMEVAKHFKFNPAMKDGTIPVSVKIMIEFKFSTNRRRTPDQMSSTTPLNPATDSPEKAPEVLGSYAMNEVADVASLPSQACEGGSLSACSRLGVMYAHGIGVTKDASLAIASFTRACNGGDAQGCVNLGISYADGAGVAVDQPRAAAIYSRACTDGNAMGCSLLGDSYRHGKGVIKDSGKAKEFLQRGCNMGDSNGCQWLKEII